MNLKDFDFCFGPLGRCFVRVGKKQYVTVDKKAEKEEIDFLFGKNEK